MGLSVTPDHRNVFACFLPSIFEKRTEALALRFGPLLERVEDVYYENILLIQSRDLLSGTDEVASEIKKHLKDVDVSKYISEMKLILKIEESIQGEPLDIFVDLFKKTFIKLIFPDKNVPALDIILNKAKEKGIEAKPLFSSSEQEQFLMEIFEKVCNKDSLSICLDLVCNHKTFPIIEAVVRSKEEACEVNSTLLYEKCPELLNQLFEFMPEEEQEKFITQLLTLAELFSLEEEKERQNKKVIDKVTKVLHENPKGTFFAISAIHKESLERRITTLPIAPIPNYFFWEILKRDAKVGFLLGTIHLAFDYMRNFPSALSEALNQSDVLAVECDIRKHPDSEKGIPAEVQEEFRDSLEGLDLELMNRAAEARKPVFGLETMQTQLAALEGIPSVDLETFRKIFPQIEEAAEAVITGADSYLASKDDDHLLHSRNMHMAATFHQLLYKREREGSRGTVFVAIGARHTTPKENSFQDCLLRIDEQYRFNRVYCKDSASLQPTRQYMKSITIHCDVGFGNQLEVRGEAIGMSWDSSIRARNTGPSTWKVNLPKGKYPWKIVKSLPGGRIIWEKLPGNGNRRFDDELKEASPIF